MVRYLIAFSICLAFSLHIGFSKILLPAIINNNMVLQQQSQVMLWGKAQNNSEVRVNTSWNKKEYKIKSDESGKWKVIVATPKAGGPYEISFSDGEKLTISNILIGEVWLCSGQSNMEITFKGYANQPILNADAIIKKANNPSIRLFNVKRATAGKPKEDSEGIWNVTTPETVSDFSAVAYQFGKMLSDSLIVPIGLISTSWGGTRIEPWMPEGSLKPFPEIKIIPGATIDTMKTAVSAPTSLFNGMVAPFINYGIKGVIWYQGEGNRVQAQAYEKLLPAMVTAWRNQWNKDFPFYYVQIAPFTYATDKKPFYGVLIREAQYNALKNISNSGMAVTMDVGSETTIHPPDKTLVGNRLAYLALEKTYGKKSIDSEGPSYRSMDISGYKVTLSFDHFGKGLKSSGDELVNFELAGADQAFFPAKAVILPGGKIELKSTSVKSPVAVRYGFKNWVKGDLYNAEGLPASSFRTDNWDPDLTIK
jgi:sialate O-acetylesterase